MNILFRLLLVGLLTFNFSGRPATGSPIPASAFKLSEPKDLRTEDEESIPWLNNRKLGWDDFKSRPETHSDAVASTNTSLGISYKVQDGEWIYSITCNFSKHKSWGLLKTDYILAHEQGHFDVTELFARKLYKELLEYKFNARTFKKDIHNIYQNIVKEKEAMQAAYDGETDHSRKKRIQYEWLERIELMLRDTEPWANYP